MAFEKYNEKVLDQLLPAGTAARLLPAIDDREAWARIPEEIGKEMVREGEKYRQFDFPVLPATWYMNFERNGNRNIYETRYFERRFALGALVVAECIENKGRFLDNIINGIWCICEETSWVVPAHNAHVASGEALPEYAVTCIDLFSAETGALLACTLHMLENRLDRESRLICERIRYEIKRRILSPYLEHDDFWWMGFQKREGFQVNNWNPWCNSNYLIALLTVEQDRAQLVRGISKCLRSLEHFLDIYHEDGGCDEGTNYWGKAGGALFLCLELLYTVTGGGMDLFSQPMIANIGRYIYRAHISGGCFVNFADGSIKPEIPVELIYRYGKRINDRKLQGLAIYSLHLRSGKSDIQKWFPLYDVLTGLFDSEEMAEASAEPPYLKDVWLPGIQFMTAREKEGSDSGLFLAAKGGHNHESHNHNDIGQFIIYSDGRPVIVDLGVETYTAKTFSPERYDIWTMQSSFHNLPEVNGIMQAAGDYAAKDVDYFADGETSRLSLDIAGAYPAEAGIKSWIREISLHRPSSAHRAGSYVEVKEEFRLKKPENDVRFHLMTPCEARIGENGTILIQVPDGRDIRLKYDSGSLDAAVETYAVEDKLLKSAWGQRVFRLVFSGKGLQSCSRLNMRFMQEAICSLDAH
jgi:hypothetical protein